MANKVILTGNVGKDPEVRTVGSDKVCKFTLATSEKWRDKTSNEPMEATEWHTIVMWKKLAELAEKYVKKGSKLYVEGKIKYSNYEKDGVKHYVTEILCDKMEFLSSAEPKTKPVDGASMPSNSEPKFDLPPSEDLGNDLPF